MTEGYDVVVAGGGSAAFEAAIAAREAGATRVLLLEKAPLAEIGGNARLSHTGFRFCHAGRDEIARFLPAIPAEELAGMVFPAYTVEDFVGDLVSTSRGRIDPILARTLAEGSNPAAHWLLDHGLAFEPNKSIVVDGLRHFEPGAPLQAAGGLRGGAGQVRHWLGLAARLGVEVRTDTPVTGLVGSPDGVTGVRIRPEGGAEDAVPASATILCTGGFQADATLRARYLGDAATGVKVKGSRHDTGEVLMAALELGAARAGAWDEGNMVPTDPDSDPFEGSNAANRFSYAYGITVDGSGERFVDEGQDVRSRTLQVMGDAILRRPGARAWQLFDQRGISLIQTERYQSSAPLAADTIEGLALAMGVDPTRLARTVAAFNAGVDDTTPFDPAVLDGRSTHGLVPPKSNWAVALDRPPFVAYPVTAGVLFSYGGLRIDARARVLRDDGRPIPGLFASGDIVGLFHGGDPSGAGQTRNVVFSVRAGRGAADVARAVSDPATAGS